MSTSTLPALTDATFDEEVGAATTPLLVDFWAEWCGPCHALTPVLEQLVAESAGSLAVATVDADEHPTLAARFGVLSLPTVLVFRDGELVHRLVGARGKHHLREELAAAGILP